MQGGVDRGKGADMIRLLVLLLLCPLPAHAYLTVRAVDLFTGKEIPGATVVSSQLEFAGLVCHQGYVSGVIYPAAISAPGYPVAIAYVSDAKDPNVVRLCPGSDLLSVTVTLLGLPEKATLATTALQDGCNIAATVSAAQAKNGTATVRVTPSRGCYVLAEARTGIYIGVWLPANATKATIDARGLLREPGKGATVYVNFTNEQPPYRTVFLEKGNLVIVANGFSNARRRAEFLGIATDTYIVTIYADGQMQSTQTITLQPGDTINIGG
jgi:hypothetical protein